MQGQLDRIAIRGYEPAMRIAICFSVILSVGCLDLFRRKETGPGTEVKTPEIPAASVETARRVETTGRKLLAGSPQLGLEVQFQTAKMTQPEILHRDNAILFITEGMVNSCQTDDHLAAVLAHQLAQMLAESRRRERMNLPEPIPREGTFHKPDGSTDLDPGRDLELAYYEKHHRKPTDKAHLPTVDVKRIAVELLKGAQIDPKAYDDVALLLKQSGRNKDLAKQFNPRSDVPRWTN